MKTIFGHEMPIAIPANDSRVLVRGRPLTVPFRIVSEELFMQMLTVVKHHTASNLLDSDPNG